jgi:uncharacterized protein (TIGR02246 family)
MMGFRNLTALVACAALTACASASAPADTSADTAALDGFQQAWEKGYNGGDAAAVVALYTEDATLNAPGAPVAHGRAAIQEFFTKDIATANSAGIKMDIAAPSDRAISGDTAWETGTWTATDKSGATADKGKYVTTYRKREGKWLIAADIWNSDTPPPPPAPAQPSKK